LVNQQKEKLKKQGTSALNDLITKNTKSKDTSKAATETKAKNTEEAKAKASELLNGLFKKKK